VVRRGREDGGHGFGADIRYGAGPVLLAPGRAARGRPTAPETVGDRPTKLRRIHRLQRPV